MGADWKFYTTSGDAWEAMYAACEKAEHSIDFEQYIFRARHVGKHFLKLFEQKARQGVKIRLLCDAFGSFGLYISFERYLLKKHGVEVMFYNPPLPWRFFRGRGIFPRDHRKITVIDDKVAFIGGVCIDERMRHWRDTHVRIEDALVPEIAATFDRIWQSRKDEGNGGAEGTSPAAGEALYLNEPDQGKERLRHEILKEITKAQTELMIATPYFVPAKAFTHRILALLDKGVRVSIMMSAYSNPISYALGKEEAGKFLKHGARFFIYKKTMLHAKTMVVDNDFAAIGSFNVDNLSFYRNYEADAVSHHQAVVDQLKRHFAADIEDCQEFTLDEWKARTLFEKAFARFFLPIKSIL